MDRHYKQKFIFAACLSSLTIFASASDAELSAEKTLQVKRISEYWKDGDFKRAKKHIISFLETTERSPYHDHLYAMLGDLYFLDNNYQTAIETYSKIQGDEFKTKVYKNLLQSHFALKEYEKIIAIVEKNPTALTSPETRFFYAESLFHEAQQHQDNNLIEKAKQEYISLVDTEFKPRAVAVLAQLFKLSKEPMQAVSLYESLLEWHPTQKENLLMEIACLQMQYDRLNAIDNFEKVYLMEGALAPKAAYNQMILLYEEGQYAEFLVKKDAFFRFVDKEKTPLLHFLLARSYFAMENYDLSIKSLDDYFSSEKRSATYDKNALSTWLSCAQKSNDIALFERGIKMMQASYPNDPELENAIVIHANLCLQKESFDKLQEDISFLEEHYKDSTYLEPLYFDYASSLKKRGLFEESRAMFLSFLSKFPESSQKSSALQQVVFCSMESAKTNAASQRILADDLISLLDKSSFQDPSQKEKYLIFLVQNLLELRDYSNAQQELEKYCIENPETQTNADILLLLAISYLEDNKQDLFIEQAEKILKVDPSFAQKDLLHKRLYNAYLEKGNADDKAREHLYCCYLSNPSEVSLQNQIWLADQYLFNAKHTGSEAAKERAHAIFVNILYKENKLMIDPSLEAEAIKFAQLLDLEKNQSDRIRLLEDLRKIQKGKEGDWKWEKYVLIELANAYRNLNMRDDAISAYDQIIEKGYEMPSYYSWIALLEKTKLQSLDLKKDQMDEDAPEISQILDQFKDLQIKKNLSSEPAHLEAALEYAYLRSVLSKPEEKGKQTVFFLERIKEDFSGENSPYLSMLDNLPMQAAIYEAYMEYIDMLIDRHKAHLAREKLENELADELDVQAQKRLEKLLLKKETLPEYLQRRIDQI